VTRIFYLVLLLLTAAAAAVQWMPRDGFPPDINLGPDKARAQAGPSTRPQEPAVRTTDVRRVSEVPTASTRRTNNGPATIYPAAEPPVGATPPGQPPVSAYPVTPYPATETPRADSFAPVPGAVPGTGLPAAPAIGAPATPPVGLPGAAVFPANQYPAAGYPTTSPTQTPAPTAAYAPSSLPTAPSPSSYTPPSYTPSPLPTAPPPTSYSAPATVLPTTPIAAPVNRPTAPAPVNPTTGGFDPFATPGTTAASNSPVSPPGRPTAPPVGPAPMPPAGGYPTPEVYPTTGPAANNDPTQPPLRVDGPVSFATPAEQELEATRVLARVGAEVILLGELLSSVNSYIARQGIDFNSPQVLAQREALVRSRLNQLIEQRAVLHEARRTIPAEAMKTAMARFDEDFDKTVVPQMLKERKLTETAALDEALKKEGTTLERMRRDFGETILFKSWLQQRVEYSHQVTHEEMLDHYQKHLAQYEFVGECRWEQLTAKFDQFPSKAEAYQNLAHWGNQVIIGQPWAEVAKAHSQGSTASQGGSFDWTKKGSLVSKPIDDALFALPVGSLSPILEDDKGFHIVRVVERKDGGRVPFTEAQGAIKKKIMEERGEIARKEYVAKIRKNAIVWNAFDDPATAPKFNVATPPAAAPMRR
jgi:hypothetical protein